jgi:hypothetical protein
MMRLLCGRRGDLPRAGRASLGAEAQLERESSLEHPGVWRQGMQSREQTLEHHALAESRQADPMNFPGRFADLLCPVCRVPSE